MALSNDCVAILDRTDSKTIRCFDTATGKQLSGTISHKVLLPLISSLSYFPASGHTPMSNVVDFWIA